VFGYDKANEWHFVKDGDLPKDEKEYLVLFCYEIKGETRFTCGIRDNLRHDFEIRRCYTEQIIAWKEIVLPVLKSDVGTKNYEEQDKILKTVLM
jgi:hypothetical protein